MYDTILVTLETTPTDRTVIEHVKKLAKVMGSRVVLLHVATGVPAQFHGRDAAGEEVEQDKAYLQNVQREMEAEGIPAQSQLAFGDPVSQIVQWTEKNQCDLVAMSTHGHKFLADLFVGTTASRVQHNISVPVLLIRAR